MSMMTTTVYERIQATENGRDIMADVVLDLEFEMVKSEHPEFSYDPETHLVVGDVQYSLVMRSYRLVDVVHTEPI